MNILQKIFKNKSTYKTLEEIEPTYYKFQDVIPDEPSITKVAFIAIKEFFDKYNCNMDNFLFIKERKSQFAIIIKIFLYNKFIIDFSFIDGGSSTIDKTVAKSIYDSVQRQLTLCDSTEFKLELLGM